MRAPAKLAKTLLRKFGFIIVLMLIGCFGTLGMLLGGIVMWLAGFIVIPVAIMMSPWRKQLAPKDVVLPKFATLWDDTNDNSLRGKPSAALVWEHGLSWGWATFLWLQFYNPLSNLRRKFKQVTTRA